MTQSIAHDPGIDAVPETRRLGGRSRTVALSPHLDDAALSAGGYLAGRIAEGAPASVVSFFTAGPELPTLAPKLRVFGDYSTRIREDDEAMSVLGVQTRRIGFHERLFRDPPLSRLTQVFRTPASATEFGKLDSVREVVLEILADEDVELLAPLGVGNHVDHVEVAVAALHAARACDAFDRVWFYEDFYALSELARRRHPVTAQAPLDVRSAAGWASPIAGLRTECIALFGRGPASTELFDGDLVWTMHSESVDEQETTKLAAVEKYRTQTAELGGERQLRAMIRRAHSGRGGERFWSARPR